MPSLIPTYAAHHIHRGLGEYLATSFSLAEKTTAASLREFLSDPVDGMFAAPTPAPACPTPQPKTGTESSAGCPNGSPPTTTRPTPSPA